MLLVCFLLGVLPYWNAVPGVTADLVRSPLCIRSVASHIHQLLCTALTMVVMYCTHGLSKLENNDDVYFVQILCIIGSALIAVEVVAILLMLLLLLA